MAVIRDELATDIVFPNISVYRRYIDDVFSSYEVYPNEGYVMYDTTDENTEWNPETEEWVPVTHYYTWLSCPRNKNFNNFTWVAVPRDSVDENYIFGNNPDHEII